MAEVSTALESLGDLVHRLDPPPTARSAAQQMVVNAVGLAIGAADAPVVEVLRRHGAVSSSRRDIAVVGSGERLDEGWAAAVVAAAAHVEDFDDTHLATMVHPGAATVASALAVGQAVGATVDEVVVASAVGAETMLRVAAGFGPDLVQRGWHVTGVLGPLGAAAAAARLLDLGPRAATRATAQALAEGAGVQSALGSMVKAWQVGRASLVGVEEARWAGRSDEPTPDLATTCRSIGSGRWSPLALDHETWLLEDNDIKPYACGVVSHAALDAVRRLRGDVEIGDVSELVVQAHPLIETAMGLIEPTSATEAKFSARHVIAAVALTGVVTPSSLSRVDDPAVVRLRHRITVIADAGRARGEAVATAHLVDGRSVTVTFDRARGSRSHLMSDATLAAKFASLATPRLGATAELVLDELMGRGDRPVAGLVARTAGGQAS